MNKNKINFSILTTGVTFIGTGVVFMLNVNRITGIILIALGVVLTIKGTKQKTTRKATRSK